MKRCDTRGCGEIIGSEHKYCSGCRVSETTDYDPRFDRAQTVEGAKARYVSHDLPGYDEDALEDDLERLFLDGMNPDKRDRPTIETQETIGDGGYDRKTVGK